jgi:hypothetical protein
MGPPHGDGDAPGCAARRGQAIQVFSAAMSPTADEVKAAIAALASPELRVRDDAAATLEQGGWPAAMQLLHASRELEGTGKARALFTFVAITYAEQIRRVRGAPRPLQLRLQGDAGEVASALQPLVGLELRVDPELMAIPVALECTCASTMAALDLLASAIGARWQQDEFGAVRLRVGAEPAYPTAYAGDLRLSVLWVQTIRRTNFRDWDVTVHFSVEVLIERPLLPLGTFVLRDVEAVDESGRRLAATASLRGESEHLAEFSIAVPEVQPGSRRIERLHVVVDALFPESHEILRLDELRPGATVTGTLCRFEVVAVEADSVRLVARPSKSAEPYPPGLLARIVDSAFLAIAEDEEELADVESFRPAGVTDEVHWGLRWKRLSTEQIGELRIRVARSLWLRSTPLDLRDVPLP